MSRTRSSLDISRGPDISFLYESTTWADVAHTVDEDLEFPSVIVEPGIIDGYHTVERGARLMGRRRLMCFFLHRHLSFRLAEFQGVAERVYGRTTWDDGLPVAVWERPLDDMTRAAFWYVHLPDDGDGLALDMAAQIADSCFLLRVILDPWADGHSLPELLEQLVAFDPAEKDAFSNDAWKIQAEAWGVSMTQEQKVALINAIGPSLPELRGPISMRDPKQTYWVIASWPFEYPVAYLRSWIFFGRQIGVNTSRGAILSKYDLRRRRYLGPTSMDSELAFLMCNMCRIRKSSFVVDPFVGTGGLLVPAAHQGAVTLGMDIDVRVIKFGKKDNKGRKVNVWTNFEDYELDPPVGLLRADLDRNPFKTDMRDMFDAILADPPYGVRAGGRKSNSRPDVLIRDRSTHIPATAPYPLGDCLADLLDWAARVLVPGGRLAYWAPALPLDEEGVGTAVTSGMVSSSEELPQHPNLVTKFNCEQILGGRYNRRLIVMEKVEGKPYDENEVKRYFVDNPPVPMSIDSLWDVVYAPTDKTRPDKSERTRTFRGKHV